MGKPTWEDINKKLGKKIYNINDEEQIDSCINELVVRHYLELLNFVNVTKLDKIEPETIKKYIDGTYNDTEYIRNKFEDVKYDIEEFIRNNNINKVELYIERGQDVVAYQIHKISNSNDRNDALKMVREIFSLVHTMHANFIVHSDLKPHNLMYCTRNGNDTLVLNDFDTSFVLPPKLPSRTIDKPALSIHFAAPEQFDSPGNIGYATDVYSVALISYLTLNQGVHPAEYDPDSFEPLSNEQLERNIVKMFKYLKNNKISWTPPKNGSNKIKETILQAMSIDKTKRPTAKEILEVVTKEGESKMSASSNESEKKTTPKNETEKVEAHAINGDATVTKGEVIIQSGDNSTIIYGLTGKSDDNKPSPTAPQKAETNHFITFKLLNKSYRVFIKADRDIVINFNLSIIVVVILFGVFFLFFNHKGEPTYSHVIDDSTVSATVTSMSIFTTDESTTTLPLTTTTAAPVTTICTAETNAIETTIPAASGGNSNNQEGDGIINVQGDNNTINLVKKTNNDNRSQTYNTSNETNVDNSTKIIYEGINESKNPPPPDPPQVEEPEETPLYSYEDSQYNGEIILTGFTCEFKDEVLEIPEEIDGRRVTGIAEKAFTNNEYIKEIHIPDIVDSIDIKAFYNLYNLERVYLGRGITMIGEQAFFADRCNKRIFYFSQYDWNSVLYGDYCLGAEGEYEIEYQNLE